MAGSRDSRHRRLERQNTYELQDIQTSHRNRTNGGLSINNENSHDDRDRGHPQNPVARLLDRRLLRTHKQRLGGFVGTFIARSAGMLRTSMGELSKYRVTTPFMVSIICILLFLAFRGLEFSAQPFDYWFGWSTRRAIGNYPSAVTVTHSFTVYRTISVRYEQFYGARPVHHQVPMVVHANHEPKGLGERQDLSHPQLVKTISTSVFGLYLMPMPITNGDWPQTKQYTHSSSRPVSNAKASQSLQGGHSLGNSEPDGKFLLQSREIHSTRNLSAGQADTDNTSFARWGVTVSYGSRHHSRRSLHFYKRWCIKNVCRKQLSAMCNATKNGNDSFRKQECEWCWPASQRNLPEIEKHCTEVSKRAFFTLSVVCGIFLLSTLVGAGLLATRLLHRRRGAKTDRFVHKNGTAASPPKEKSTHVPRDISKSGRSTKAAKMGVDEMVPWYKAFLTTSKKRSGISPEDPASSRPGLQKQRTGLLGQQLATEDSRSHERVPVLPPAPPPNSSRVSPEIENMGQGSLVSGAGTNGSQHEIQGMPRRSSRQSRAVSSGSGQNSTETMRRRDAGPTLYNLHRLTERS